MRFVLFAFFFYGVVAVWAQVNTFLGVTVQNDFLNYRGHGTDRYYTGGNQVSLLINKSRSVVTHHYFAVTQQLYTPDNLQDTALRYLDYPYAGLLFLSYRLQLRPLISKTQWALSFSGGYSGRRSGARQTQQFLHRAIGDEIPLGWDHIVENGLFSQFQFLIAQPLFSRKILRVSLCQLIDIGSLFRRVKWGLPFIFGSSVLPMGSLSVFLPQSTVIRKLSLAAFVMPTVSRVFSNRLLQGSSHASAIQVRALCEQVAGLEFGVQLGVGSTTVHFIQYLQQREFKQAKPHAFGEIALVFRLTHKIQ